MRLPVCFRTGPAHYWTGLSNPSFAQGVPGTHATLADIVRALTVTWLLALQLRLYRA